jgi:hypothetical protein
MLAPYGEIGGVQAHANAVVEEPGESRTEEVPPISRPEKRFRMRHPDRPVTRRWNFDFYLGSVLLHAVCGEVEVAADAADILEKSGWIRIRSE